MLLDFLRFTFENGWHYFGILLLILAVVALIVNLGQSWRR